MENNVEQNNNEQLNLLPVMGKRSWEIPEIKMLNNNATNYSSGALNDGSFTGSLAS